MQRFFVLALLLLMSPLVHANTLDVFGLYLTEERNSVINIEACGESVCGTVVWLNPDSLDQGVTPDTATSKAGEKILGLTMLKGFEQTQSEWRDGTIYDPGKDKTYASRLKRLSDKTLEVKGCIAFFCQTQIWTPVLDLNDPLNPQQASERPQDE